MVCEQAMPKMDVEVENNKNYRLPEDIQDGLRALVHNVTVTRDTAFAVVQAVYRRAGEGVQSLTQENLEFPREANNCLLKTVNKNIVEFRVITPLGSRCKPAIRLLSSVLTNEGTRL